MFLYYITFILHGKGSSIAAIKLQKSFQSFHKLRLHGFYSTNSDSTLQGLSLPASSRSVVRRLLLD
jgi:hypothetical protein